MNDYYDFSWDEGWDDEITVRECRYCKELVDEGGISEISDYIGLEDQCGYYVCDACVERGVLQHYYDDDVMEASHVPAA